MRCGGRRCAPRAHTLPLGCRRAGAAGYCVALHSLHSCRNARGRACISLSAAQLACAACAPRRARPLDGARIGGSYSRATAGSNVTTAPACEVHVSGCG